jgi:hypothetical protein
MAIFLEPIWEDIIPDMFYFWLFISKIDTILLLLFFKSPNPLGPFDITEEQTFLKV